MNFKPLRKIILTFILTFLALIHACANPTDLPIELITPTPTATLTTIPAPSNTPSVPASPVNVEWVQVSSEGPSMIVELAMEYDSQNKLIIGYGGRAENFNHVNETWAYDYQADSWTNLQPEISPPWRASHAMVYDPSRNKIFMFGGDDFSRSFNDLWEYDYEANTWRELHPKDPPDPRHMHGMVYDTEQDIVIVFGGRRSNGGAYFDDTWAYSFSTNSWRSLNPVESPPVQDHINMAYDVVNQKTLLFGGPASLGNAEIGTWAYDYTENSWSELHTNVSPLSDHSSFLYHPKTGQSILYGNTSEGNAMETWIFDYQSTTWTDISSNSEPLYREHFSMIYDEEHDVFILSGGYPNHDNWALKLTK